MDEVSEEEIAAYENYPNQLPIRLASGCFSDDRLIVALLYRIMRNELATGIVEEAVQQIIENHKPGHSVEYTNGWLAAYCANIVDRLEGTVE